MDPEEPCREVIHLDGAGGIAGPGQSSHNTTEALRIPAGDIPGAVRGDVGQRQHGAKAKEHDRVLQVQGRTQRHPRACTHSSGLHQMPVLLDV